MVGAAGEVEFVWGPESEAIVHTRNRFVWVIWWDNGLVCVTHGYV